MRTPAPGGKRRREKRTFPTYSRDLERCHFELLLVNAKHVKMIRGRKTDVADAAWLAQLLECGLLRGTFIPPPEIPRPGT